MSKLVVAGAALGLTVVLFVAFAPFSAATGDIAITVGENSAGSHP